jgi:hypothetical protein
MRVTGDKKLNPFGGFINLINSPDFSERAVNDFERLADKGFITFDYTPRQPRLTRLLSRLTDFPPPSPFQLRPQTDPEIDEVISKHKSNPLFRPIILLVFSLFSRTIPLSYFFKIYKIPEIPKHIVIFHYKRANYWLVYSAIILFAVLIFGIMFFFAFLLLPILIFARGLFAQYYNSISSFISTPLLLIYIAIIILIIAYLLFSLALSVAVPARFFFRFLNTRYAETICAREATNILMI